MAVNSKADVRLPLEAATFLTPYGKQRLRELVQFASIDSS